MIEIDKNKINYLVNYYVLPIKEDLKLINREEKGIITMSIAIISERDGIENLISCNNCEYLIKRSDNYCSNCDERLNQEVDVILDSDDDELENELPYNLKQLIEGSKRIAKDYSNRN